MNNSLTTDQKSENSKKIISFIAALAFIILAFVAPHGGSFTKEMSSTVFLIIAALIMWSSACIPIIASSLLIIALMPILGVKESLSQALSGFTSTSTYFVIASVVLGLAITRTRVPYKIMAKLFKWSHGKVSRLLLAYLLMSYLISMWVSDTGAVVLAISFVSMLTSMLDSSDPQIKRLCAMLSLAAPVGAVLGGNSLVVGSTVNVVTINMLNSYSGQTITFLQWMIMGLPACLVTLFLIWRVMLKIFKASDLPNDVLDTIVDKLQNQPVMLKHEGITLVIILITMICWFATTWIKIIDITTVAIFGMVLLLLPEYGALNWDELKKGMPWELPFIGACSVALGQAVSKVGLTTILTDGLIKAFPNIGQFGMVALLSGVLTIIVMAVPVGPATAGMMTIPAYMLAEALGLNPIANVMVVGIFAANSCILPLNATFMLPYSRKMFTLKQCASVGICLSLIWIVVCTIWLPISTAWLFPF